MKHVFDINIKELKNIPILTRFIREARDFENATLARARKTLNESQDSEDLTIRKIEDGTNYI